MTEPLSTTDYDHVVVIDTQVVLEARPLEQLPWEELFPGSVLLVVSRQVQKEIDAKKNDGRLGRRARTFNKLLDSFIETRLPTSVIAKPRIDVALLASRRVDWDALDGLDRDDGDDRIIAEALNAIIDNPARLIVFSHDMRPRDAAITHNLKAVKLPESWLREPEPSPDQRRLTELEGKIRLLSADQPQISVSIDVVTAQPWQFQVISKASSEEIESIIKQRLSNAPRVSRRDPFNIASISYDSTHSNRFETWVDKINEDIPLINEGITRLFSQYRVRVSISNTGSISAEGLSLEIKSGNTVLHSMPYWVLISGHSAPTPRSLVDQMARIPRDGFIPRPRDQFSFYWDVKGPGDHIITSCRSFRQEKTYNVEISVEILNTSVPNAQIEAVVTASNMKGDARKQKIIPIERVEKRFQDVYDTDNHVLKIKPTFKIANKSKIEDLVWYLNDKSKLEDY